MASKIKIFTANAFPFLKTIITIKRMWDCGKRCAGFSALGRFP
jgi:hypothetical protein